MDTHAAYNFTLNFISKRLDTNQEKIAELGDKIDLARRAYLTAIVEQEVLSDDMLRTSSNDLRDLRDKLERLVSNRKTLLQNSIKLQTLKGELEHGAHGERLNNLASRMDEVEHLLHD